MFKKPWENGRSSKSFRHLMLWEYNKDVGAYLKFYVLSSTSLRNILTCFWHARSVHIYKARFTRFLSSLREKKKKGWGEYNEHDFIVFYIDLPPIQNNILYNVVCKTWDNMSESKEIWRFFFWWNFRRNWNFAMKREPFAPFPLPLVPQTKRTT